MANPPGLPKEPSCLFCRIVAGEEPAFVLFEDDLTLAFLDARPLFPGHTLLVPRGHYPTLPDVPPEAVGPLFTNARRLCGAVQRALGAEGSLLVVNNRVSQSMPHLHVHIVPRRRGDGLRGFFWPRRRYASDAEAREVRDAIRAALAEET